MKNEIQTNDVLLTGHSKRATTLRGFIILLAAAVFIFGSAVHAPAAATSVLGEQDYADGDIIGANATWTSAQAGEPYPFDTIHIAPATITFTHTGLDTGRDGILTFSLWDLDAEFAGNQVTGFSLDGIPQDISAFELPATDLRVNIFSFLIDQSFLSDGELVVSLTFGEPPAGNEVGIDFSRVDVPPAPVSAPAVQRWSATNGFYALTFFGDGTLLATSDTFVSGAGSGVKLNPSDGSVIDSYFGPDVRVSVRLSTGDGDWIVGGYQNRTAWDQDGNFLRLLRDLGCCNIPRFPLALDHTRDVAYVQANGQLFGLNMTTGATQYFFYGAGDTFGMISIADPDTLYTSGRNGNVSRLHPQNGPVWLTNIDTNVDMQPGAVAADGSFVVATGSAHFAGTTSPGRLARVLPDSSTGWNKMVNAVTPPVIGSNGLIFVGTQPAPISENGPGKIEAFDPITGNLAWSTPVQGLPNDLLVGDDGAVYAGTGGFSSGRVYALGQSDGAIRQTITDVPGAWEIVLRAGLLYASGFNQYNSVNATITAIPVAANNYDPDSPWPVRYHDNQRTSNRMAPILNPPRDVDPDQEFPITINPQNYTGNYYLADFINPLAGPFTGIQTLNLKAGYYQFDNGNTVGGSAFGFTIDTTGQITNITNPAAATANGNTLLLNNAVINIDPQAYTGRYNFNSFNTLYTGARNFTVIPGLRYGIDNGTSRGGAAGQSYFYFEVGANGEVSNIDVPLAAYGDGNTLYFYNTTLMVEPNGYTGNYNLSSYYTVAPYVSGQQSFVLIPGLLYAFDAGTGSFEPTFKLDTNGTPMNIDPIGFASGINNTLVLANVPVHIDPTNYGGNYRLNDRFFSGMQDQVLIPYVRFYVSVNNAVGYFVPTQTEVTPPSVTLSDGANSYVFNFFPGETTPPTSTVSPNPDANAAGWNKTDVVVSLTAVDNAGGTGVKNITYSTSGAQTTAQTVVSGSNVNLTITFEGETTLNYFAEDNAGNVEPVQTLVVRIDRTAPEISATAEAGGNPYAAGTWTNQSVLVSFDCTDPGSGVADITQPVTLSNEGANQSADGTCTDLAGNNADTSFADIDIDKTAPTISVAVPTDGSYLLNEAVAVDFDCSDALSGVASCTGTNASGGQLDTGSIGAKTFTVAAVDNAGNSAPETVVNYTVKYGIEVLFDQNKSHKSGSTVPIKIGLIDANGVSYSSASTVVHAVSVIQIGSEASTVLEDAGNSNPDFDFRYSGGKYIFNLKTKGYGTGTYQLNFIAGNSPAIYSVQFQVRQ